MNSEVLLNHMPDYYKNSNLTKSILKAISNEFSRFLKNCEETKNELKIYTASKTLSNYEKDFVIPISNSPDDYRISNILAKLRGQGIITIQKIKDIAKAYSNSEVEITKIPEQYTLIIKFVGITGVPPNLEDLKSFLNSLKAADWVINYEFTYNTWGDILESFNNWNEPMDYFSNWSEVKNKTINKKDIAKKYNSLYYFDISTNSYKKLIFK